jgi:hypothetical protein
MGVDDDEGALDLFGPAGSMDDEVIEAGEGIEANEVKEVDVEQAGVPSWDAVVVVVDWAPSRFVLTTMCETSSWISSVWSANGSWFLSTRESSCPRANRLSFKAAAGVLTSDSAVGAVMVVSSESESCSHLMSLEEKRVKRGCEVEESGRSK